MPLIMCPNCHSGMKEIAREGVQFDMCPECHGVWLDRGELQKLLEASRGDIPETPVVATPVQAVPQAPMPPQGYPMPPGYAQQQGMPPQGMPPQPGWHRHHDDSDDDHYKRGGKYYGKPYRKKSAMERIFDIFD